ncbi:MerR family transcriptional regulator [Zhaonella formicivorans]|uniref:MerR family transcriptional regulator n=1 Tax=Zhaonella formicivorans TaxID=2528593 RepID=UPI0010DBBE42|nr:MerR family transcriptional regulator [Zhaonella formicivorans]
MTEKLTIQQVSHILQVEVSTLRFWEKEFEEYLQLKGNKGARKRYNQDQLEVFSQIKELLQTEQYTIKGAKRRLELDRTLASALGVEQNFKTTVFHMFNAIMEELQKAREESKKLAHEVQLLRTEKELIEGKLLEEQNKGLFEFLRDKLQLKKTSEAS